LSIGVLDFKINENFELKQGTLDQRVVEMVPSTTKLEDYYVKLKIALEDEIYPKAYYHHSQINIELDGTPTKILV
jgi:hypothetical protein